MKWKSLGGSLSDIGNKDLLKQLLKQRGVEDIDTIIAMNDEKFDGNSVIFDGKLLKNVEKALKCVHFHVKNGHKIGILWDVDVDGCTSGALMYNYIKDISNGGIEPKCFINKGKAHGLDTKHFNPYDYIGLDLLILVDSSSSDNVHCDEIYDLGIDVVILDHHDFDVEHETALVVNNQDGQYPNTHLSGVAVCYKFAKEYDKAYGHDFADKYLDLVCVGIVGDSIDVRNPEARYLALQGLKMIGKGNKFFNALVEQDQYNLGKNLTFVKVSFFICPLINSLMRYEGEDQMEMKHLLIRALRGDDETFMVTPKRKTKNNPNKEPQEMSLQEYAIKEFKSIKSKQDTQTKNRVKELQEHIDSNELDKNKFIIVDTTNILTGTENGLVASKLSSKYQRPIVLVRSINDNLYGGSMRGYSRFPIQKVKEYLTNTQLFEKVQGHEGAAGVNIKKDKLDSLIEYINDDLKDVEIQDVFNVDFEIPIGQLKERQVETVGAFAHYWGGKNMDEPTFAITNIIINSDEIQLTGEKNNTIRFEVERGGNKFVFKKFMSGKQVLNEMTLQEEITKNFGRKSSKKLKLDIIGKFECFEFNGLVYPYINIVSFDVVAQGRRSF